MNNYNLKIEDIDYNKLLNREPILVDNIKTHVGYCGGIFAVSSK